MSITLDSLATKNSHPRAVPDSSPALPVILPRQNFMVRIVSGIETFRNAAAEVATKIEHTIDDSVFRGYFKIVAFNNAACEAGRKTQDRANESVLKTYFNIIAFNKALQLNAIAFGKGVGGFAKEAKHRVITRTPNLFKGDAIQKLNSGSRIVDITVNTAIGVYANWQDFNYFNASMGLLNSFMNTIGLYSDQNGTPPKRTSIYQLWRDSLKDPDHPSYFGPAWNVFTSIPGNISHIYRALNGYPPVVELGKLALENFCTFTNWRFLLEWNASQNGQNMPKRSNSAVLRWVDRVTRSQNTGFLVSSSLDGLSLYYAIHVCMVEHCNLHGKALLGASLFGYGLKAAGYTKQRMMYDRDMKQPYFFMRWGQKVQNVSLKTKARLSDIKSSMKELGASQPRPKPVLLSALVPATVSLMPRTPRARLSPYPYCPIASRLPHAGEGLKKSLG